LDLERFPVLPKLLGSSNFLARLLLRHPGWVEEVSGSPPEPPAATPIEPDWKAIRIEKYRGLLRIAARDLAGRPFEESLRELSDLADRCLGAALACAARETAVEAPALFALGKLGGRELNFASDVDLIFIYDAPDLEADLRQNEQVARLVRTLKRQLESPSDEGFGYRVDLDLRPEGRTGVLANSLDAALSYYETFGAEWERQMLIRLRLVAGPEAPAREFAKGVEPFVYRRLIDPQAISNVREMKARIETQRRGEGRDLARDLKEGPGGIRDVEFLVQALQLLYGGRQRGIRNGNVLHALKALRHFRLLPEPVAESLRNTYLWLRRAEHSLQLVDERQTQRLPRERAAQTAHARRMGYREPDAEQALNRYLDAWTSVRTEVRGHFEDLVLARESWADV
jgi:glutamate-ammonia-ligase adenylyltransferase